MVFCINVVNKTINAGPKYLKCILGVIFPKSSRTVIVIAIIPVKIRKKAII